MADSQALAEGISPLTGAKLTDAQNAIIAKYIDMEAVNNRLALYNLQNPSKVAGAVTGSGASNNIINTGFGTPTSFGFQGATSQISDGSTQNTAPAAAPALSVSGTPTADSVSVNIGVQGKLIIQNP